MEPEPSISDPFLPKKIYENKIDCIRECIGCNICVSMDGHGLPIRCTEPYNIRGMEKNGILKLYRKQKNSG